LQPATGRGSPRLFESSSNWQASRPGLASTQRNTLKDKHTSKRPGREPWSDLCTPGPGTNPDVVLPRERGAPTQVVTSSTPNDWGLHRACACRIPKDLDWRTRYAPESFWCQDRQLHASAFLSEEIRTPAVVCWLAPWCRFGDRATGRMLLDTVGHQRGARSMRAEVPKDLRSQQRYRPLRLPGRRIGILGGRRTSWAPVGGPVGTSRHRSQRAGLTAGSRRTDASTVALLPLRSAARWSPCRLQSPRPCRSLAAPRGGQQATGGLLGHATRIATGAVHPCLDAVLTSTTSAPGPKVARAG